MFNGLLNVPGALFWGLHPIQQDTVVSPGNLSTKLVDKFFFWINRSEEVNSSKISTFGRADLTLNNEGIQTTPPFTGRPSFKNCPLKISPSLIKAPPHPSAWSRARDWREVIESHWVSPRIFLIAVDFPDPLGPWSAIIPVLGKRLVISKNSRSPISRSGSRFTRCSSLRWIAHSLWGIAPAIAAYILTVS